MRAHRSGGYDLRSYGQMINDLRRTAPYVEALRRVVKPGMVVLDIGTGPGYFALLASKLGAERIYAVEPDSSIEVGRSSPQAASAGRITWIQDLSTNIDLPEAVDVIVGDLHGMLPFFKGNIGSLIDARERFLKPGGVMLPRRDTLRVVPACAPTEYEDVYSPWTSNPEDIDLTSSRIYVVNSVWRAHPAPVDPINLLAPSAVWGEIDYVTVESDQMDATMHWTMARGGTMHGYYVWFDGEVLDGLSICNSPEFAETVYGRVFFPLEQPVAVAAGDRLRAHFNTRTVSDDRIYSWGSKIVSAEGKSKAAFKQSTFRSRPILREDIRRNAADAVPSLGSEGSIELFVLQAISQSQSIGEIADGLVGRFPERFASRAPALSRVAAIVNRL